MQNSDESIIEYLSEMLEKDGYEAGRTEDGLSLLLSQVTLSAHVSILDSDPNGSYAGVDFHMKSPQWDREISDSQSVMATSQEEALRQVSVVFYKCLLLPLLGSVKPENIKNVNNSFEGKEHRYEVRLGPVANQVHGDSQPPSVTCFWDILKDELVKRLGNGKLYVIKVYCASVSGSVTTQVQVNGVPINALSQLLIAHASKWEDQPIASQKQFIVFKQDEETWSPYRYTQAEFIEKFKVAVNIYGNALLEFEPPAKPTIVKRVAESTGDLTLAKEIVSFTPEICAMVALSKQAKICDEVVINKKPVYVTQIPPFIYIANAIGSPDIISDHFFELFIQTSDFYRLFQHIQSLEANEELEQSSIHLSFEL
jgi:hypothetical protein